MKAVFRLVLLVALVTAGVWLWTVLFPGPEKIVRKRLVQVAAEASFNSGENPLVIAARRKISPAASAPTSRSTSTRRGSSGRKSAGALKSHKPPPARACDLSSLKVEFPDVSMTFAPDKLSAVADVAVKVQAAGEKDFNVQEMKFTFQKIGGDWLITRVETVRAPS